MALSALDAPAKAPGQGMLMPTGHSRGIWAGAVYACHTLYLFTASDVKTVLVPSMIFAFSSALGLPFLVPDQSVTAPLRPAQALVRAPAMLLYIWLNLLHVCLANQRRPSSVGEDLLNKPWRPIPAGRVSAAAASRLLAASYLASATACTLLGAPLPFAALVVLNYLYNERGGSDHCLAKSLLNGLAIPQFGAGALQVAMSDNNTDAIVAAVLGRGIGPFGGAAGRPALGILWRWVAVLAATIATTIHVQDLADMVGDASRGRSTIPLVFGEGWARWGVAVATAGWSATLPYLWGVPALGYLPVVAAGFATAVSVLACRSVAADKRSLQLWCVWMVAVYALPLIRAFDGDGAPFFITP